MVLIYCSAFLFLSYQTASKRSVSTSPGRPVIAELRCSLIFCVSARQFLRFDKSKGVLTDLYCAGETDPGDHNTPQQK